MNLPIHSEVGMERKANILITFLLSVAIVLSFLVLYEKSKPSTANAQCVPAEGGMFNGWQGACAAANPYTGDCTCPAGFTPRLIFNFRSNIHMCLP